MSSIRVSRTDRLSRPAHPPRPRPTKDHSIGWHEPELPTRLDHLPSTLMHEAMVEIAEQDEIAKVARPTPRPKVNVMRGRPVDLAITARPATTSISNPKCPPLLWRYHPRRPADIDHHRVGEQHTRDGGIASDALQRARRNRQ